MTMFVWSLLPLLTTAPTNSSGATPNLIISVPEPVIASVVIPRLTEFVNKEYIAGHRSLPVFEGNHGRYKYRVQKMKVLNMTIGRITATIEGTTIRFTIEGLSARVKGDWKYARNGWVNIHDKGTVETVVRRGKIEMRLFDGNPETTCTTAWRRPQITFTGTRAYLYNFLNRILTGRFQELLKRVACAEVVQILQNYAGFETRTSRIHAAASGRSRTYLNGAILNYFPTSVGPFVSKGALHVPVSAQFRWLRDFTKTEPLQCQDLRSLKSAALRLDLQHEDFVSLVYSIDICSVNQLLTAAFKHNLLRKYVTEQDAPGLLKVPCERSYACLADVVLPHLEAARLSGNSIEILLSAAKAPKIHLAADSIRPRIDFVGNLAFYARSSTTSQSIFLYAIEVRVSYSVKLELGRDGKLVAQAKYNTSSFDYRITDYSSRFATVASFERDEKMKVNQKAHLAAAYRLLNDAFVERKLNELGFQGVSLLHVPALQLPPEQREDSDMAALRASGSIVPSKQDDIFYVHL